LGVALPFLSGRILDVGCGSGELAHYVAVPDYVGVDPDEMSLAEARLRYPRHTFACELPPPGAGGFETIVALAVIEHVKAPHLFLGSLTERLAASPKASIVLTTPHPLFGWMHAMGATIGLFSRHAHEEHETLLGRPRLESMALACNLRLIIYRRFLLGANQLAVLRRRSS
jgi:2-polyprenyl-3-methyl-5-hydroxy-6-metoxy-1,4-benzoquinol methylase